MRAIVPAAVVAATPAAAAHPQTCKAIISWPRMKAPAGAASLPWRVDRRMGVAGPGPSDGADDATGGHLGFENDFTRCSITIMSRNPLPRARMPRGGLPDAGRDRNERAVGPRFGVTTPQYRS